MGFAAKDGCGNQGDEQVDREGFDEGVEGVDERVLVGDLGLADGGYFGLDRGGGAWGGLDLLDLGSEVAVHEAMHEIEVEDLPSEDIDGAGDESDADADRESSAESDVAVGDIVAVGADAEEDEQCREDDRSVANEEGSVAVGGVAE